MLTMALAQTQRRFLGSVSLGEWAGGRGGKASQVHKGGNEWL